MCSFLESKFFYRSWTIVISINIFSIVAIQSEYEKLGVQIPDHHNISLFKLVSLYLLHERIIQ